MANFFWVQPAGASVTGIWDGYNAANWAAASGGAGGAGVPTVADNVYFDANSGTGTCTVSNNGAGGVTGQVCHDLDCTGYTGTLVISGITLTISGSPTFVAGMTLTAAAPVINFTSTGAETITMGTKTFTGSGTVTFNGVGGSWQNIDTFNTTTAGIILTNGTWDTNGVAVTAYNITSSNTNIRVMTFGASAISLATAGGSTGINFSVSTNMTLNAGTSVITYSGDVGLFYGGGLTFFSVLFTANINTMIMTGANTFTTLTIVNTAAKTCVVTLGSNIAVTGTFTVTSNSIINRILVKSDTVGTARTITAAVVALTNVDFADITAAGVAAPFTSITTIGDCLGNTNITPTAAVTRYAVAAGNASSTATWSNATGGVPGFTVPLGHDIVILDGNSGVGTITMDMPRIGVSITCTGYLGTIAFSSTPTTVYGNPVWGSAHAITGTQVLTVAGRGAQTYTSSGRVHTMGVQIVSPGGGYTLQDAFAGTALGGSAGSLTTGGFVVSAQIVVTTGTFTVTDNLLIICQTLLAASLSGGTVTFSGTVTIVTGATSGAAIQCSGTAVVTFSGATTITCTNLNSVGLTINLGTVTFSSTLTITTTSGKGISISGGTSTFTGAVTVTTTTGNGIDLSGGTPTFSNTVAVTTTTGVGLNFTSGATTTFSNTVTITTTTGNVLVTALVTSVTFGNSVILPGAAVNIIIQTGIFLPSLQITNAAAVATYLGDLNCGVLILTGAASLTMKGNSVSASIIGANMNIGTLTANTSTVTFTQSIQLSVGSGSFYNLTVNGGVLTQSSNVTVSNTLTLTKGTILANNFNMTVANFSSSNTNNRTLNMGNGKFTLTGVGTVWDVATTTNMVLVAGNSQIVINDATAAAKTFSGGGLTYNDIYLTAAGTGAFNFVGSNTFNTFRCDTPPHTIGFTGATNTTVRAWLVSGSAAGQMTLTGIAGGAWTLTLTGGGTTSSDYLTIDHCTGAPGAATWYVGTHSVDALNNANINFIANPTPPRTIWDRNGAQFMDSSQQVAAR